LVLNAQAATDNKLKNVLLMSTGETTPMQQAFPSISRIMVTSALEWVRFSIQEELVQMMTEPIHGACPIIMLPFPARCGTHREDRHGCHTKAMKTTSYLMDR
jgi:hypothetical protein